MWNAHLNRRKTLPTKISFLCVVTHSSSKSPWSAHRSRYWLCHTVDHDRIWFCTTSVTYIYWMAYDGTLHTFPDDDGHLWERQSISWLLVRVMWDTHSCILGRLLHKRISMQLVGVLFKVLHGILHITIYAICFWCISDFFFFFMFVIEWNLLEWNWY